MSRSEELSIHECTSGLCEMRHVQALREDIDKNIENCKEVENLIRTDTSACAETLALKV